MTAQRGVQLAAFEKSFLYSIIGHTKSADYLVTYLGDLGVRSVAIEHHYVDRHYLDEFSHYYSKSFNPPVPHCRRLHFFAKYDQNQLAELLRESITGADGDPTRDLLQDTYVGFCVIRPLSSAPLGRTVVKTYPKQSRRHYEASRPYTVNLCGLSLKVEGLAFQNQDGGAAVCASTSLWSALQRVAYSSGHRTPTPYAITEAAGSPYPASHGLTDAGMATAIRRLGYSAEYFVPADNRAWFRALIVASLQSRLPVILLLAKHQKTGTGEVEVGHAITLTGFSEPSDIAAVPFTRENTPPLPMRAGSLKILYAHDDNLGPHAHYELTDSTEKNESGHERIILQRGDSTGPRPPSWSIDHWRIEAALVPKPEKLRYALASLLELLDFFRPALDQMLPGLNLHYSGRFDSGVAIQAHVKSEFFDAADRLLLLTTQTLPRHVGVLSAFDSTVLICEFVLDATDVGRDGPEVLALLAQGVVRRSQAGLNLELFARKIGSPIVFAPALPAGPVVGTAPPDAQSNERDAKDPQK